MYTITLQDHSSQLRLWLALGVFLRLALRLGYHRDPSHYPFLTPFEGEMRRRMWCLMWSFDVLSSFSIGLPDMIRQVQSDVKLPQNFLDADFYPSIQKLPPARPPNEITPSSYMITKTSVSRVFARAADLSHQVDPPDHAAVQALDQELEKAHEAYPAPFRIASAQSSILDPSPVIFNRFKLELLYLRTKCVLHRRYLITQKTPEEENSRESCVNAAIMMLRYLDEIAKAKVGGQLTVGYMFNNISSPDFLLSAMVVCVELNQLTNAPIQTPETVQQIRKLRDILEMTYSFYIEPPTSFRPPEKAVKALELMLGKKSKPGMFFDGDCDY
jgi:Fungal specific transcription factor domain